MLTVRSRKGDRASIATRNSGEYTDLLTQISLLDPSTWPIDYDSIPNFGEEGVSKLSDRLRLKSTEAIRGFKLFRVVGGRESNPSLQALRLAVESIPVSTAECERGFSLMNNMTTQKRNCLDLKNASHLMFISLVGPPMTAFDPASYV